MKTLTITYPEKNLVGESLDVNNIRSESQILSKWKKMYGQFFDKCKIEIEWDGKEDYTAKIKRQNGYIRDLRTGEVYFTLMQAAKESKRNECTIRLHCKKLCRNTHGEFDFEYV